MSQINLKSITGITSITTPAGVDNVFTVHTNDTTERFRVDSNGNQVIAGILTVSQDLDVDGHTNLDNVSITGVTTFAGDTRITGSGNIIVGNGSNNGYLSLNNPNPTYSKFYFNGSQTIIQSLNQFYVDCWDGNAYERYVQVHGPNAFIQLGGDQVGASRMPKIVLSGRSNNTGTNSIQLFSSSGTSNNERFDLVDSGITITGLTTFVGNIDANGDLDVDGHTELDNVNIVGVTTHNGTTNLYGNGGASVVWGDTGYTGHLSFDGSSNAVIRAASGKALIFQTDHVNERLRITSSGEVKIGTSNPTTFRYVGTGHPTNNNNYTVHGFSNIGLVGQYSSLNMPFDHSTATTSGAWWMLGRSSGNTNEWGLYTRSGGLSNLLSVWKVVGSSNGNIDYQTFSTGASSERIRITSSGEMGVNTTAPVEKLGISGNMRFVNPNGTTSRITALPSGTYSTGTSGGAAVCFQRTADGAGGSDEIFFETHWQGNRHGESCRINKYGNLKFPSGQGIDFSSQTNEGSTSQNALLGDYEEGVWTPTNTIGMTLTVNNGCHYLKIGKQVTVWFDVTLTGNPDSAQCSAIMNLPYVSKASNTYYGQSNSVWYSNTGNAKRDYDDENTLIYVNNDSTNINIWNVTGGHIRTRSWGNGRRFRGTVTYIAKN